MSECLFIPTPTGGICILCNEPITLPPNIPVEKVRRVCAIHHGLGDRLAAFLSSIGITEESVSAAMKKVGLPPSCGGCEARRKWLNAVGESLSIDSLANRFSTWLKP